MVSVLCPSGDCCSSWESGREEDSFRALEAGTWFPWTLRLHTTLDWLPGKQIEGGRICLDSLRGYSPLWGRVIGFKVEYVRRPPCRPGSRELGLEWERHRPPSDPLPPARPHFQVYNLPSQHHAPGTKCSNTGGCGEYSTSVPACWGLNRKSLPGRRGDRNRWSRAGGGTAGEPQEATSASQEAFIVPSICQMATAWLMGSC